MAYNDETASLVRQLRSAIEQLEDSHTREMTAAWVRAWDEVAGELDAALLELVLQASDGRITRKAARQSTRLLNAITAIETQLNGLLERSAGETIDRLADVVAFAGATQEQIIASMLPPSERATVAAWSQVDVQQIAAIVERTTEQITKRTYPLSDKAVAAMKRELVRGVALGANPRETARQMVKRTEGLFNGGLTRALTIARTETLDAHRAAARLADEANSDVVAGWTWVAALSERTCRACWAMNGREFPTSQAGPNGHQNCRCTRVPKTKTWRELGFDVDEPPSLLPDAEARFADLTAAQQRAVLGARGYDAWKAGRWPMDRWAMKRETPGWRDSWAPAPMPAAA